MKMDWNPPKIPYKRSAHWWEAEYAAHVHEGGTRLDGTRFPARPWTELAVNELIDVPLAFKRHFEATNDISDAFEEVATDLDSAFKSAIQAPVYAWDRPTHRANGEYVTTPRNIVDTGELLNSQRMEIVE